MLSGVFRKRFVELVDQEHGTQDILDVLEVLLVLVQKFWKELGRGKIAKFAQTNYPDEYALYLLLWGIGLEAQDLRQLQQALQDNLGEGVLHVQTSDPWALKNIKSSDIFIKKDTSKDVSLRVSSPNKLYKRSLSSDLDKMLRSLW